LLANGALSLRGQRGEHDDDAVVARRALDKVPELVAVEPDDGALEGELPQLLHLLSESAAPPTLLLPAHRTPTTMYNRLLYGTLSFTVSIRFRHLHFSSVSDQDSIASVGTKMQCFGSGSGFDQDSIRSVDSESVSGSGKAKMT
jgi:hypothetical protein